MSESPLEILRRKGREAAARGETITEMPSTEALADRGRQYVGITTSTLDGVPAAIMGRREDFATVGQLPHGLTAQYAWATVARIVEQSNGAFRS